MPTARDLGTINPTTPREENPVRYQFVRIDFPDPVGILRMTNFPVMVRQLTAINLWDPDGVPETGDPEYEAYHVEVLGISQEERNPLEVTAIELANLEWHGVQEPFLWIERWQDHKLREKPIVISEVWWPQGDPISGAWEGATILYIGATDGSEIDFLTGKVSISVIPFRPAHDVTIGEEYQTSEWVQLPDPNTPLVWGPEGAHRLTVG